MAWWPQLKQFGEEFVSPKALYWRAKIQAEKGMYAEALQDLEEVMAPF